MLATSMVIPFFFASSVSRSSSLLPRPFPTACGARKYVSMPVFRNTENGKKGLLEPEPRNATIVLQHDGRQGAFPQERKELRRERAAGVGEVAA